MDVLFKEQSHETFMQVLEDALNNLYNSDQATIQDTNKTLKEDIRNIILRTNFNISEITELLLSKHFDETKVKSFISLLNRRKNELFTSILIHHNCAYGDTLINFDWKLKLVCGTSQLKTMAHHPLLQLLLYTVTSHCKKEKSLYELNTDSVARLIEVLEKVTEE